jgi:hypothetical protein
MLYKCEREMLLAVKNDRKGPNCTYQTENLSELIRLIVMFSNILKSSGHE